MIHFIKRIKSQTLFRNASTLPKLIDNTAETKIYPKLNRREKILRQHTTSDNKIEYVDSTISWY